MNTIGAQLRQARTRKRLSLDTLAERMGMNAWHIGRIERGIQLPQLGTLQRLAGELGLEVTLKRAKRKPKA